MRNRKPFADSKFFKAIRGGQDDDDVTRIRNTDRLGRHRDGASDRRLRATPAAICRRRRRRHLLSAPCRAAAVPTVEETVMVCAAALWRIVPRAIPYRYGAADRDGRAEGVHYGAHAPQYATCQCVEMDGRGANTTWRRRRAAPPAAIDVTAAHQDLRKYKGLGLFWGLSSWRAIWFRRYVPPACVGRRLRNRKYPELLGQHGREP